LGLALLAAVFASFEPPVVPRLLPSVYWLLIDSPLVERRLIDSIIALYSLEPPLVLTSISAYGFCTPVMLPAASR
jgi:hypothetical protein